jgi:hypothetical protein
MSDDVKRLREGLDRARAAAASNEMLLKDIDALNQKLDVLASGPKVKPGTPVAVSDFALTRLSGAFGSLLDLLQDADVAPSTQAVAAVADLQTAWSKTNAMWNSVVAKEVPALNAKLAKANIAPIQIGGH